jgi:RNA polymerase sigma-70 factor (ECF subfamily)
MEADRDARVEAMLAEAGRMRRLATALLRGGGDVEAEDVVQEAHVAALTHPVRNEAAFLPWLRRVARHFALESRRRRARRESRERLAARDEAQPAVDELSRRIELHHAVLDALAELPGPYRLVVSRRFLDGVKPARIAQELGEPVATVKTRLRRALARMRERLQREWGGELGAALTTLTGRGLGVMTATSSPAAGGTVTASATTSAAAGLPATATTMGAIVMSVKGKFLVASIVIAVAALVTAERLHLFGSRPGPDGGDVARPAAATATVRSGIERADAKPTTDATRSDEATGEARPRHERLDVRRLATLRGRVVDEQDRAVTRARVEILRRLGGELPELPLATSPDLPRERHEVIAGEDGRFEFADLVRGGVFNVLARDDRGARGIEYRQRAGQADDVVVHLTPSTTVFGHVVDAVDGRPVAGASVFALRNDASETGPLDRATTAADGSFTIEGVQPAFAGIDRTSFFAITEDGRVSAMHSLRLVPNGRVETTLSVGSERSIEGLVVDATSGDPIAGAVVQFGAYGPYHGFVAARSAADGRFRVSLDTSTETQFRIDATVGASGYAPTQIALSDPARRAAPLRVALQKGLVVRGRIVTRDGDPVADAVVSACPSSTSFNVGSVVAVTDRNGAFRLEQVPPFERGWLLVRRDEHERLRRPFSTGERNASEIDLGEIRIGRGALLAGTLVDELGRPLSHGGLIVANATIEELRQSAPADADRQAVEEKSTGEFIDRQYVECDERGRFECRGLAAGSWSLRAASRGYCGAPVDVAIQLADEEIRDDLTIVVPQRGVILGRVVDERGRAVADAGLTLFGPPTRVGDPPDRRKDGQTEDDGRFQFTGLADGPFEISITPHRYRRDDPPLLPMRIKDLMPAPTELEVVVPSGSLLVGVVEDAQHAPVAYALVQALDEGGFVEVGRAEADVDGRFELELPRDFDVRVIARRSRPYVSRTVLPRLDGSEPDASDVMRARTADPPLRLMIRVEPVAPATPPGGR